MTQPKIRGKKSPAYHFKKGETITGSTERARDAIYTKAEKKGALFTSGGGGRNTEKIDSQRIAKVSDLNLAEIGHQRWIGGEVAGRKDFCRERFCKSNTGGGGGPTYEKAIKISGKKEGIDASANKKERQRNKDFGGKYILKRNFHHFPEMYFFAGGKVELDHTVKKPIGALPSGGGLT